MGKTAFITGITGQDGAYLSKLLLSKGYEVHGGVRRILQPEVTRLEILEIADQVTLHEFDLTEQNGIFRTIRDINMDEFYNLAAQSLVDTSWELPVYTAEVDGIAVAKILDTLRMLRPS
ncbi:MAG: GDP-mannose 4,6-dehydratase, partial [Planctomycetes bacterium]|nr:GDP-mannose 4,6-dehydratase [Planctomycetota bacterium]